jgi:hypothetical protein
MSYEVEDQVDWSDGSLDNDILPTPESSLVADSLAPERNNESNLPRDVPTRATPIGLDISTTTAYINVPPQRQKVAKSRTHNPTVGVEAMLSGNGHRPTQHQLTMDELSKFVLYQANQKIYEAMFVKMFVSHALHPDRINLKESLDDNAEAVAKIEGYLQDVSNNVSQLTNKMIWNAHFKTTNFLAKSGQDCLPFINIDNFKSSLFNESDAQNSHPIVQKMNQSWHRICKPSDMVKHAATGYPIGTHYSPFEDIQEATTQNLFVDKGLTTGRIMKPPMKKRVLPGPARRDSKTLPQVRVGLFSIPTNRPGYTGPESGLSTSKARREIIPDPTLEGNITSRLPVPTFANSNAPNLSIRNSDMMHPDAEPSPLEQPSRLDILFAEPNIDPGQKNWRMRLISDHKRRLAERRVRAPGTPPREIKSIIARAVERGLLQRSTTQAQYQPERHVAKRRQTLYVSTVNTTPTFGGLASSSCPRPKSVFPSKGSGGNRRRFGQPPHKKLKIQPNDRPLSKSPSGSRTLEPHQVLPPNAYFKPEAARDEKPVWRCGINHCMGNYYNAGDRSFCIGCNTNIKKMEGAKTMDFYLPSKTYFFQAAPEITWKPSKLVKEVKKSSRTFHNAIAKAAWYAACNTGATEEEALQQAREAVLEHIRPKPKREPDLKPTPEPEPEPMDHGPHPSGSTTMEHGQGIPQCHSFRKIDKFSEFAWRCDGGHALGRYYMAGDKHTCPGCGLGRTAKGGRWEKMDFFMPSGAVVRQEAPDLVEWRPRRKRAKEGTLITTHNQICTKFYHDGLDRGQTPGQALAFSIKATDEHLDAKNEEIEARLDEMERKKVKQGQAKKAKKANSKVQEPAAVSDSAPPADEVRRSSDAGVVIRLVPRKRDGEEVDSDDEAEDEVESVEPAAEIMEISSCDESSSGSDSE